LVFFTKVDTKFKKDPILFLTEDIYLKMVPKEYKYNILESAFDMPIDKGLKASLETKAKMSQAHLGKKHSEETKMKISQTLMGRKAVATTYPKKKVLVTNLQTKEEKTFLSVKD